jgi:hypothetical protein
VRKSERAVFIPRSWVDKLKTSPLTIASIDTIVAKDLEEPFHDLLHKIELPSSRLYCRFVSTCPHG